VLNELVDLRDRENDLQALEDYEKNFGQEFIIQISFTGFLDRYFHTEFLLNDRL
jgi:hypothetical protein